MNSDNMAKVLEGNYDEKTGGNGRKELVPGWMESRQGEAELAAIERLMRDEPKTAGNDPTIADRAEKLKQQLSGK